MAFGYRRFGIRRELIFLDSDGIGPITIKCGISRRVRYPVVSHRTSLFSVVLMHVNTSGFVMILHNWATSSKS